MKKEIKNSILKLLSRREYSEQELTNKLLDKDYNLELITEVINQLKSENLQSDYRTAQMLLSHGYKSGWGPNKIRQQMQQRGLSSNYINQVFQEALIAGSNNNRVQNISALKEAIENYNDRDNNNSIYDQASLYTDWYKSAKEVAVKKFGDSTLKASEKDLKTKAKIQRFLYNRGFEQDQINFVISNPEFNNYETS